MAIHLLRCINFFQGTMGMDQNLELLRCMHAHGAADMSFLLQDGVEGLHYEKVQDLMTYIELMQTGGIEVG